MFSGRFLLLYTANKLIKKYILHNATAAEQVLSNRNIGMSDVVAYTSTED